MVGAFRPVQGHLRARHLGQHEDGGRDGLRRQGPALQSPLPADVQPPPRRSGCVHAGLGLGQGASRKPRPVFLNICNRRHRSVVSGCGVGRRHGMLRGAGMSLLSAIPQWVYWFPLNRAFAGGGGASFKAITSLAIAIGWTAAEAFDASAATLTSAAVADPGTSIGASVAVASARRVSAGPGT